MQPMNQTQSYLSMKHIRHVTMNICLSSILFGFTVVYFNTINFDDIIEIYQLSTDNRALLQGLLTACIPISAGLGALSSSIVMTHCSRRNSFIFSNIIMIMGTVLLLFPYVTVLFFGRFIQGCCIGVYSSIGSIYIREFCPTQLTGQFGLYHQLGITLGITTAFFITFIFDCTIAKVMIYWRILFMLPIILVLLQTYNLLYVFPYETPRYLISIGNKQAADQLIRIVYKAQFVSCKYKQIEEAVLKQRGQTHQQYQMHSIASQNKFDISLANQNTQSHFNYLAISIALHLACMQQFVGVGVVINYGGQIILIAFPNLEKIMPIFLHFEGVMMVFISLKFISLYGRVYLLQLGCILTAISHFCLVVAFNFSQYTISHYVIIVFMFFLRGLSSFSTGPIVWLYIPEIVPPSVIPYSTFLIWFSTATVMISFPLAKDAFNPQTIFLTFGIYTVLSIIINHFGLVQTKDKTEVQIAIIYDQKLYRIHSKLKQCDKC